jgi:hypothetical protein
MHSCTWYEVHPVYFGMDDFRQPRVQFSSSNLKLEKVRISVSTRSLEASTFILQNRASCADEERICSPSSGYLLPSTTTVSNLRLGMCRYLSASTIWGKARHVAWGSIGTLSRSVDVTHGFEEAIQVSSLFTGPNACFLVRGSALAARFSGQSSPR